jgi:acetoacetate decarboxylase
MARLVTAADVERAAQSGGSVEVEPGAFVTDAARERAAELGVSLNGKTPSVTSASPVSEHPASAASHSAPAAGRLRSDDPVPQGTIYIAHTMVQVVFRSEPGLLPSLLPAPLKATADSDLGLIAVLDTIYSVHVRPEPVPPEMSQFMEAYLAIPCEFEGQRGRFFPFMWLDRSIGDAPPAAGGYVSKQAEIAITRVNPAHGRLSYVGPGLDVAATVSREGRRILDMGISLERKGNAFDMPLYEYAFTNYGLRYYPDASGSGRPLVHQLLRGRTPDRHVLELWHGPVCLSFKPADNEVLAELGPKEVVEGHYVTFGYRNIGSTVIHDYLRPSG